MTFDIKEYRRSKKEQRNKYNREWRAKNKERFATWCSENRAKNKDWIAERLRRWRLRNPEKNLSYYKSFKYLRNKFERDIMRNYGIEPEDWARMYIAQHGLCAICKTWVDHEARNRTGLVVDHCHSSGLVRGLLCGHCSKGLGYFRESKFIFEMASRYLAESEGK